MPERGGRKAAGFKVSPVKAFVLLALVFFVCTQFLILYSKHPSLATSHAHKPDEAEIRHVRTREGAHRGPFNSSKAYHLNENRSSSIHHALNPESFGGSVPAAFRGAHIMTLPGVALDRSEMVLSSLIERTSDSAQLHLTTFFLNAAMVTPQESRFNKAERIRPDSVGMWREVVKKLNAVAYLENGKRSPRVPYFCRVFNSQAAEEYKVPGEFVPNRQTTDPNTNRRVDILRCPLKFSEDAPRELFAAGNSPHSLFAEILRQDTVVARFSVRWSQRRAGYLMSPLLVAGQEGGVTGGGVPGGGLSSELRTWEPDSASRQVHLCVVGLQQGQLSQGLLGQMTEFIEYHVQSGVGHMYFALHFSEQSAAMGVVVRALRGFIRSGHVSVTSTAGDGVNMIDSFGGIKWNALSTDTFVTNTCLYLAKGAADHLGVWDLNEYFVPRPPHSSVLDVVRAAAAPPGSNPSPSDVSGATAASWVGGRGWADGNSHPFCYLSLHSADAYMGPRTLGDGKVFEFDMSYQFAFDAASTRVSNTKAILPTRLVFQAGILSPGVCQLAPRWANCDMELLDNSTDKDKYLSCVTNDPSANWVNRQTNNKGFQSHHEYDDVVTPADGKALQMQSEGYLFRLNAVKQGAPNAGAVPFSDSRFPARLQKAEKSLMQKYSGHGATQRLVVPMDLSEKAAVLASWPQFTDEIKSAAPPPSDPADALPANLPEEARIKYASGNGYMDFKEHFARPDVLENPGPSAHDLPAFAADHSDIAVGAVIERKHSSWDLHLTTFMLNHNFFWQPIEGYGMARISKKNKEKWEKVAANFNHTSYSPANGKRMVPGVDGSPSEREESRYRCRMRNSNRSEDTEYLVPAEFMPNKLTPDMNANNRLDVLRCEIQAPEHCYRSLAGSDQSVQVTIVGPSGLDLFHFEVSWSSRRTGYLLSAPQAATSFQPWKAFDPQSPYQLPGEAGGDLLYMSVPGVESSVSQFTLPMYLEFLQHHYLLGVQHVFLAGTYAWNGAMMSNLLTATRSFIAEGLLSVNSQAGDNFDLLYSFLGGSLDRDTVKIFHVNMYLYLSKGVVDYLGVWDVDEYFIPMLPHHTITDVIRAAESPSPLMPLPRMADDPWAAQARHKPGPGWADGDAHPFCYLMLSSDCIFSSLGYPEVFDPLKPWAGQKYPHAPEPSRAGLSFKKSIIPTRRIFQAGLHMHGACDLGREWAEAADSPCANTSDFCNVNLPREQFGWSSRGEEGLEQWLDFAPYQKFDAVVKDKDAKKVSKAEGYIYHFQFHRSYLVAGDEVLGQGNSTTTNEYVTRFFPTVLRELKRRRLNVLVTLPESVNEEKDPLPDEAWTQLWPATVKYVLSEQADAALQSLPALPVQSPRHLTHPSALPLITKDFSDVILGALIERQHDSWSLQLTTFFLCKEQLANYTKNIVNPSVRPDALGTWMRTIKLARALKYTTEGKRDDGHVYYCKITNHDGAAQYKVRGDFIPNEMTPDANANKRLDVLRCPIDKPQQAYRELARSGAVAQVEVLRGNYSLANFTLDWHSRRTGFMLSAPREASRLDVWKGFDRKAETLPGAKAGPEGGGDDVHMCVPGIESPMSKQNLAMYAENVQHHLDLGVQHVHLAATYTWGSTNMDLFMEAFGGLIAEGRVSVVSAAGDEDLVYGLLGMSMHRDNVKIFYVNMCLYLTKGMVDYLAIWDVDEYFIPMLPHHTIMDVIRAQQPTKPMVPLVEADLDPWQLTKTWRGGPGWADGDGHAFCYLQMHSEVLFRPEGSKARADSVTPWVGMRFTREPETKMGLAFKKPILPTRVIFQAGLHMAGGCKLEHPWSGCPADHPKEDFCLSTKFAHRYGYSIRREPVYNATDFSFEQRFDGLIMDKDTRAIDEDTQAVLYHVQLHRHYFTSASHENSTNQYVARFYPRVVRSLRAGGLELPVVLPTRLRSRGVETDEALGWQDFDEFYDAVKRGQTGVQQRAPSRRRRRRKRRLAARN